MTCRSNFVRFRLSPNSAVALAARAKRAGKDFLVDQRELYLTDQQPERVAHYDRLLGAAMVGNEALSTTADGVGAAWAAIEPALATHRRVLLYERGSWGPKEADAAIAPDGFWCSPEDR